MTSQSEEEVRIHSMINLLVEVKTHLIKSLLAEEKSFKCHNTHNKAKLSNHQLKKQQKKQQKPQ